MVEWRNGEWAEVRSAWEIAATLDSEGCLDGVPFMPEMLEYCGRSFRVLRKAEKTCVELPGGAYSIREFRNNDVILLEGLRCSGASHGECQRQCMFFWKEDWLRKTQDPGGVTVQPDLHAVSNLQARLKTRTEPGRFLCQSTKLADATHPEPIARGRLLAKCVRDVRSGAVGIFEMLALVAVPLYRKVRDRIAGRPVLRGNLTRTPVGELQLQPGEWVRIKTLDQMQMTLDARGRNRGLVCDIELKKFCGTRYRVRSRLDRMISEPTGEMRQVHGTVILEGNTCMCARALGGCPRLDFCYWREVWLERDAPPSQPLEDRGSDCVPCGGRQRA